MAWGLVRVDSRLIHGQVLETWVPYLQCTHLVVANDAIAACTMRRELMMAAVPRHLQVIVASVADVLQQYQGAGNVSGPGHKTLLLVASIADAWRCYQGGMHFMRLNVGNQEKAQAGTHALPTVVLDKEDVVTLDWLWGAGVDIGFCCVPRERRESWDSLRKRLMESG